MTNTSTTAATDATSGTAGGATSGTVTSATTTSRTDKPCPFCTLPASRVVQENEFAVLILDGYPVSLGHSLIIPKRHVGSFFDATAPERPSSTVSAIST